MEPHPSTAAGPSSRPPRHGAAKELIRLLYRFRFDDGTSRDFEMFLDSRTAELRGPAGTATPEWTELSYYKCENCPLPKTTKHCPVAVNLAGLIEAFRDFRSYDKCVVEVETAERTYIKRTTVQKGLSALIGIFMVTSNCPIMDKLRPMVRFHLPFATPSETIYRAVTMYLLSQFFVKQKGRTPDWDLEGLQEIYKAVNLVNKWMTIRISNATHKDANVNAVVILHSLADAVPHGIQNGLDDIEHLFDRYLRKSD
jgi:hypothetical protein